MQTLHLAHLAETYAAHVNRSVTSVAEWAGLHSRLYRRLRDGHGCRVQTYNRAVQWLSDHWPADLEWPSDIPRPPKSKKEAA